MQVGITKSSIPMARGLVTEVSNDDNLVMAVLCMIYSITYNISSWFYHLNW